MPIDERASWEDPEVYSRETHETWFGQWCIRKEFADQIRAWAGKDYAPMEKTSVADYVKATPIGLSGNILVTRPGVEQGPNDAPGFNS